MICVMESANTITGAESWWWCFRCRAFVDVRDPGEPYPRCERCGRRKLELRRPENTPDKIHTSGELAHKWFDRMREVVDHNPEDGQ